MSTSYPPKCRCTPSERKKTVFFRHCGISALERYRSVVPSTVDSHVQYIKPRAGGLVSPMLVCGCGKAGRGHGLELHRKPWPSSTEIHIPCSFQCRSV